MNRRDSWTNRYFATWINRTSQKDLHFNQLPIFLLYLNTDRTVSRIVYNRGRKKKRMCTMESQRVLVVINTPGHFLFLYPGKRVFVNSWSSTLVVSSVESYPGKTSWWVLCTGASGRDRHPNRDLTYERLEETPKQISHDFKYHSWTSSSCPTLHTI